MLSTAAVNGTIGQSEFDIDVRERRSAAVIPVGCADGFGYKQHLLCCAPERPICYYSKASKIGNIRAHD